VFSHHPKEVGQRLVQAKSRAGSRHAGDCAEGRQFGAQASSGGCADLRRTGGHKHEQALKILPHVVEGYGSIQPLDWSASRRRGTYNKYDVLDEKTEGACSAGPAMRAWWGGADNVGRESDDEQADAAWRVRADDEAVRAGARRGIGTGTLDGCDVLGLENWDLMPDRTLGNDAGDRSVAKSRESSSVGRGNSEKPLAI